MLPFTWSRNWSVSWADFWMALTIAVFCCERLSTCAWTSLSAEAVVESGAIVCVGFWTGAVEQPPRITAKAQRTATDHIPLTTDHCPLFTVHSFHWPLITES